MAFPMLNLTEKQLGKVADILADIGVVVAASTILPSILVKFNLRIVILGLIATLILFFFSIKILKQ